MYKLDRHFSNALNVGDGGVDIRSAIIILGTTKPDAAPIPETDLRVEVRFPLDDVVGDAKNEPLRRTGSVH